MGVGDVRHAPAALHPRKRPFIYCIGGWVWTDAEGLPPPHRDSIPDRPAHSSVAIPTEVPGPKVK